MADELNTIVINDGNELRLERMTLPNGNTYIIGISVEEAETIFNTLNENISAVNEDVLKNEEITADALIAINTSSGFDEHGKYSAVTDGTYISGATSVKEATAKLDTAITSLNAAITESVEKLRTENQTLKDEIAALKEEIALIKEDYVSYVNIDDTTTNATITE